MDKIRAISLILMGLIFLYNIFISNEWLNLFISILAILVLILYFPKLIYSSKILVIAMNLASIYIYFYSGNLIEYFEDIKTNLAILCIFIFVPFLIVPIRRGDYLNAIDIVLRKLITNSQRLYGLVKICVIIIGAILNMGSLHILYNFTNLKSYKAFEEVRMKALIRGVSLAFLWSPYFVSVAVVLSYFNIDWIQIFLFGIIINIIGILIGYKAEMNNNLPIRNFSTSHNEFRKAIKSILILIVNIILVTALIILIDGFSDVPILSIVPLTVLSYSILWMILQNNARYIVLDYYKELIDRGPKMGNEVSVFLSAGLFGSALLTLGSDKWILKILDTFEVENAILLIPILALLIIGSSFIGLHPIVTVSTIGVTLSQVTYFMDQHFILAIGILISWMVTVILSPFSSANLIMTGIVNRKSMFDSFRMNYKYALSLWVIAYFILIIFSIY
ncbi:hypothetical protein ACFO0S_04250 [Chryseomicrobium palamuruense]|uniref:Uncharacterized protein n=1 Tax=Chryseomicrobium palamuruense TaxID=682973 RepID=A0ABV8UT39_9BACL